MIEKEKLEAVAIDFADIKPVFETSDGNAFDASKVFTVVKAKNEKGIEEKRLVTSERDIEIQMEVGLANSSTNDTLKFMENVFSVENPKIYSRMPDNMLDFLNEYFTKYNRYPNVNANINIYNQGTDSQGKATYTLSDSIQGPIVARYKASRKPMEQIEKMLMDALMNAKEKQAQIPMTNQHYYIRDDDTTLRKDALITSTDVSVVTDKGSIDGVLVITKRLEPSSTEPVTKANSYDCTYPYKNDQDEDVGGKYVWGVLSEDEQRTAPQYKKWVESSHCFGKLTFVMNEQKEGEEDPQYLDRIEFADLPELKSVKMGLCMFTGHTEESARYLYAVDGFLEEKYDRELKNDEEADTITETAQNIRFKFQLGVKKESTPPEITFDLESSVFKETDTYEFVEGGKRTTAVSNVKGDKANGLQEKYMYLDPALHLPTIYRETEDEIPFSLKPADYHTI